MTGAIQRLERLSIVNYIDKIELETCLLSPNTLSSLVRLLPDLWVREMTITGLDFKNPVGVETFNCFKRVCIIERNMNESSRYDPVPKKVQNIAVKKVTKSTYKVQQQEGDSSGNESEPTIHAMSGIAPKPWNPYPWTEVPLSHG